MLLHVVLNLADVLPDRRGVFVPFLLEGHFFLQQLQFVSAPLHPLDLHQQDVQKDVDEDEGRHDDEQGGLVGRLGGDGHGHGRPQTQDGGQGQGEGQDPVADIHPLLGAEDVEDEHEDGEEGGLVEQNVDVAADAHRSLHEGIQIRHEQGQDHVDETGQQNEHDLIHAGSHQRGEDPLAALEGPRYPQGKDHREQQHDHRDHGIEPGDQKIPRQNNAVVDQYRGDAPLTAPPGQAVKAENEVDAQDTVVQGDGQLHDEADQLGKIHLVSLLRVNCM